MKTSTKAIIVLTAAGAAYFLAQKRKNAMREKEGKTGEIYGFASPGFEPVREAFAGNFLKGGEIGGDPRDAALRNALYTAAPVDGI